MAPRHRSPRNIGSLRHPRRRSAAFYDPGLQHERTSLAWERTAVSMMVSGILLARYAGQTGHPFVGLFALGIVVFGAAVLVWAALHYDELHALLRAGSSPAHPTMSRIVGMATVAVTATALIIVVSIVASS